ncbi:Alpha/Beta hydrolase protein [Polychytrium aggregatum]|uniref:Alpha/Beta hydrolase protein n=1 Tax=Polychytrium aggregatum TaxID=110093 RepID=UPI0022FF0A45|nr:Alpha/Beta hydrolase protein [Polychytrium aggregatum]KAI9209421.1 Alpha/Beta hydrolase protein [Polychytrium aggregatum]
MHFTFDIPSSAAKEIPAELLLPASRHNVTFPIGIILTHGAVGTHRTPHLDMLAQVLAEEGLPVLRFTNCGNIHGRTRAYRHVVDFCTLDAGRLLKAATTDVSVRTWIFAGRSFGSRIASILGEQSRGQCLGTLLISFPILSSKDDGTKEQVDDEDGRLSLLLNSQARALVVVGSKDKLCPIEMLDPAIAHKQNIDLIVIDGGNHSLNMELPLARMLAQAIAEWCREIYAAELSPPPAQRPVLRGLLSMVQSETGGEREPQLSWDVDLLDISSRQKRKRSRGDRIIS